MTKPRILIVAGSESDLPIIAESGMLDIFGAVQIDFKLSVASAHRNPAAVATLGTGFADADVIIGVAGLAAALPGALAGATEMMTPIIGVPLDEHGIDSCLYMPPGVPVLLAGVGKHGLNKAAIAAVQISAKPGKEMDRFHGWLSEHVKHAVIDIDPSTIKGD